MFIPLREVVSAKKEVISMQDRIDTIRSMPLLGPTLSKILLDSLSVFDLNLTKGMNHISLLILSTILFDLPASLAPRMSTAINPLVILGYHQ